MSQQIIFDLDDTLIYCNRYFFRAIDSFAERLVSWFNDGSVSVQDIKSKQTQFDTELILQSGFKSEHFPQSFIETYLYYSDRLGRPTSDIEKDWLWRTAMAVYNHNTESYPHMEDTLQLLKHQGHELHLYTGGEHMIQTRKIEAMGLTKFFDERIYIRQVKNIDALNEILLKQQFERERTWMIGNSIRTDIVPALTAGIHAIHVQIPDEWGYNIVDLDVEPKGHFFSVQSLHQIPSLVVREL